MSQITKPVLGFNGLKLVNFCLTFERSKVEESAISRLFNPTLYTSLANPSFHLVPLLFGYH